LSVPVGPETASSIGVWSTQKLEVLRCYLGQNDGFLKATNRAGQRHYIDLFAGPGRNRVRQTDRDVDGSPLIAVRAGPPAFTTLHWVDSSPHNMASLALHHRRDYPGRDVRLYLGDGNERVDDILRVLPRRYPVLVFLDPYGAELHWQTVVKLARHRPSIGRKVELLILFAYDQALARLMPRDPGKMVNAAILDRMMPSPEGWRRVYERRPSASAFAIRQAMLDEYVAGLRDLGYAHVPPPLLIRRPSRHPLYFLVFASDHEAGQRIMVWCLEHAKGMAQQLSFLPYTQR